MYMSAYLIQNAKWAGKDDIIKMIDDGSFIPYHKSLIELLFGMRKCAGAIAGEDVS